MNLHCVVSHLEDARNLSGIQNEHLRLIGELFHCVVELRGDSVLCDLTDPEKLQKLEVYMQTLLEVFQLGTHLTTNEIVYIFRLQEQGLLSEYLSFLKNRKPIGHTYHNKPLYAKTLCQQKYLTLLEKKDLIFSMGAAGTGKTYLAVVYAVSMLKKGFYEKVILTRPAVEAGESLGFLPGDFKEKVDPYLRPLYDALYDLLGVEQTNTLIEKQVLEIAPLAYMRGRTLEKSVIILDEAQNATKDQLKMFLTRLGVNSKMIITGDCSQVDLPVHKTSGLKIAAEILKDLSEVGVIEFGSSDVIRHPLVAKIIERFENK